MAACRYVLASHSYISKFVVPIQNQICLSSSRYQPYTVMSNHHEQNKKKKAKQDLFCSVRRGNVTDERKKYNLQDNVLVITGGSKGIGSQIVRLSLEEGVKQVVNLDDDTRSGLALQAEMNMKYGVPNAVKFVKCDLNDEGKLAESFESIMEDKDNTYLLVNNAAMLDEHLLEKMEKKHVDFNVAAIVAGSLAALELMRKDNQGRGGAIINISSVAALCPLPLTPVYNATKSAVLTFSIGLGNRDLYNKTGVRVMTLCFAPTDTDVRAIGSSDLDMANNLAISLRNWPGQMPVCPEIAARAVIDAFKQGETGSTWLSSPNKPAEDITHVAMRAYSFITQRSPL